MSSEHAVKEHGSLKVHGDKLESALGEGKHGGSETADAVKETDRRSGSIPPADNGGHPRSAAAHLGGNVHDHTKPEGDLRHGAAPGALREPPQEISRVGKQHR